MPLLHNSPFTIRVEHDGAFTDSFTVRFLVNPGGEVAAELSIPVAELANGQVEKSVTLAHGNYLGRVTATGPAGSVDSDDVPVPVFAPLPGKPILVIVTT